jgi:hypothetical protein
MGVQAVEVLQALLFLGHLILELEIHLLQHHLKEAMAVKAQVI